MDPMCGNMLNTSQQEVFKLHDNGHNVLVTGQAGTGKTFVLKAILGNLRERKIAHAATHLREFGATTVHRYYLIM
jgi:DNA replication protein DnaC